MRFEMPVKILMEEDCVKSGDEAFSTYGKRALIVTDGIAGRASGAMDDLNVALKRNGVLSIVYDRVRGTPSVECVNDIVRDVRRFDADLIIAVGGGSCVDAGKMASLLATQKRALSQEDMITCAFSPEAIPMIAVPTTSGSGAEVLPRVILIGENGGEFVVESPALYPKLALLNYLYTQTVPWHVTVDTVLEAMGYAIEAATSAKHSAFVQAVAKGSLNYFNIILNMLNEDQVDSSARYGMMSAGILAGIAASQAQNTCLRELSRFPAAYFNISQGRALGLLIVPYLRFIRKKKPYLINTLVNQMGLISIDNLNQELSVLIQSNTKVARETATDWASKICRSVNIENSIITPSQADLVDIYMEI